MFFSPLFDCEDYSARGACGLGRLPTVTDASISCPWRFSFMLGGNLPSAIHE